ncbi:MAG: exodeoxyribonuclease VII large subunit, partial [Clostridiales bacterium]|nr:exodeoxyribonuclease VII large subunit [Clostridiales bacterium]
LALAFEQLQKKLEEKGLFDSSHKLSLPAYPENIGVISSPTGAAVQDVLNVLGRRYPLAPVYFCGVKVQGEDSAEQIIDALARFNKLNNVDVIIIARGGGSIEDLWEFNDEGLAQAIYDSHIPVISGVGHETDYTICDLVADRRAPTPSAAAELAVPDSAEQLAYIRGIRNRLNIVINGTLDSAEYRYASLSSSNVLKSPLGLLDAYDEKLNNIDKSIDITLESSMERFSSKHVLLTSKLESLSPLKVLSRGYSLVKTDNGVVDSVKKVKINDDLNIRLSDGEISARVTEV